MENSTLRLFLWELSVRFVDKFRIEKIIKIEKRKHVFFFQIEFVRLGDIKKDVSRVGFENPKILRFFYETFWKTEIDPKEVCFKYFIKGCLKISLWLGA